MLWLALALLALSVAVLAFALLLVLFVRPRPQAMQVDPRVQPFADLAQKYFEKYLAEVQKHKKPIPEIDPASGLPAWVVDRNHLNKN